MPSPHPVFEPMNTWAEDTNLQRQMQMRLGADWEWARETLARFGQLSGGPVFERAHVVDKENHRLDKWNRWGEEQSVFTHHPLYLENVADLYGAGIIGFNYQKENRGRYASTVLTSGWGYMVGGADIGVACPICMTHGAVYLLEKFGSEALREKFLPALVSTNPADLHTAGMLLTEITGGSDLKPVSTEAVRAADQPATPGLEKWVLSGEKWFTSNAGGDVFMVLARPQGAAAGTRGLAVFVMPAKREDGTPNGIEIRRIKNKLGTRNVATGEMVFQNAEAWLLGEANRGIHYMLEMVNFSRLFNAVGSLGLMARCYFESRRYCRQRTAFGKVLDQHPLVQKTLVDMAVELAAGTALTFEAAEAFERTRQGDESAWPLLRILTPLSKYSTAEQACDFSRETLCLLGGNGTVEDFRMERLYRDALILPIWEGTANIQSLDLFRAMAKEAAHQHYFTLVDQKLAATENGLGAPLVAVLREEKRRVMAHLGELAQLPPGDLPLFARDVADLLCHLGRGAFLLAQAQWEHDTLDDPTTFLAAARFIQRFVLKATGLAHLDRFAVVHFAHLVQGQRASEEQVRAAIATVLPKVAAAVV